MERLDQIRSQTLQAIAQLEPVDLESICPYTDGDYTVRQMLIRLLQHEYYHTGQINYIALLLSPNAVGKALPPPP